MPASLIALLGLMLFGQVTSPVSRARQFTDAGNPAEAERILRQALAEGQDSADIHGELGGLLFKAGHFREAVAELGRAAQIEPKNPTYAMQLAGAILGDRRFSVARDYLEAVRNDFQELPEYQYNLGLAYYGLRIYPNALEAFQRAFQFDPKLHNALFFAGNTQAVSGDVEAAAKTYRRAIELDPRNASYCLALGKLLSSMGPEYAQESQKWLKRALALKPGDTAAMFAMGIACERAGDLECARANMEQVSAKFPDELGPHVSLGRVYARLKEGEKSRREAEIVRRLQSKSTTRTAEEPPSN